MITVVASSAEDPLSDRISIYFVIAIFCILSVETQGA
jgi:hypothetical protein